MTYLCGIGAGMAAIGIAQREPQIVCNKCGLVRHIYGTNGFAPNWFLNRKPAPGWSLDRVEHEDGRVERTDLCPRCRPPRGSKGARK
jgi:hypothetical protein